MLASSGRRRVSASITGVPIFGLAARHDRGFPLSVEILLREVSPIRGETQRRAVRHVNKADGLVPIILLKGPYEVSVVDDGT